MTLDFIHTEQVTLRESRKPKKLRVIQAYKKCTWKREVESVMVTLLSMLSINYLLISIIIKFITLNPKMGKLT